MTILRAFQPTPEIQQLITRFQPYIQSETQPQQVQPSEYQIVLSALTVIGDYAKTVNNRALESIVNEYSLASRTINDPDRWLKRVRPQYPSYIAVLYQIGTPESRKTMEDLQRFIPKSSEVEQLTSQMGQVQIAPQTVIQVPNQNLMAWHGMFGVERQHTPETRLT